MKIYVITKGWYSEYHICAVATDADEAAKLAKFYTDKYDCADVEEFDTDAAQNILCGRVPYHVNFYASGGVYAFSDAEGAPDISSYEAGKIVENSAGGAVRLKVYVLAPDEDTAKKIAIDKRAQYLAEKAGI